MVKKFDIEAINNIDNIQDLEELKIFYYLIGAIDQDHEEEESPYTDDLKILESKIMDLGGF